MKKAPKSAAKSWLPTPKCVSVVYYVTREFFFDDKTPAVERGDQEGTVSPNWLSTLELWRHLYTGNEKSFVRKDLPTNFKSHFQGFDCNDEETF